MRQRLFEVIEVGKEEDHLSRAYDFFMLFVIVVSIIPLWSHTDNEFFNIIDKITVGIFIIDYLLRWSTADKKVHKGALSFLIYPFTFWALIDLISILPSITVLEKGFRLFKLFRLMKTLKVFRIFKAFRYSKNIMIIINVFKKQKESLMVVVFFAIAYIIISALIMFNAEPETFTTMFDAIYWATISLTTVGYGDVYAISKIGKIVTMVSAVLGIAVVALPAGIIIAGYQDELEKIHQRKNEDY